MFEERAPSPCFDSGDLSKDFGLDITVSDGGLVTSANNQRQYQTECTRIYQQFVLNMADYINEEAQLRKTLNVLQSQKRIPSRKSAARRPEAAKTPDLFDEDAFTQAQMEEFKNILNYESARSRSGHAGGGFAGGDGQTDGTTANNRSQTPNKLARSVSTMSNHPTVSHMFPALKERPASVKAGQPRRDSKAGSSVDGEKKRDITPTNNNMVSFEIEYDGIMEPNAELSNNRRIRMNQKAFTKLMTGQVKVKLMNKTGDFVLTPVSSGSNATALTPEETEKQLMDNREKVAVVKQRTTFKSPTLSSDLKISNLVAIQKALKGQSAKRVTVGEVMKSARDRKARLFRVQMSGNRFDEFDRQEEDLGYVHEVKAATDLGEEENVRPHSRLRFSPHINMLRQSEQRPESRLRSPTPIPLHILDPKAAANANPSRANTPGILKQVSVDCSALTVHKECSEFEHRYSQAVDQNRPKDHKKQSQQMSVVQLDFDDSDGFVRKPGNLSSSNMATRARSAVEFEGFRDDHQSGMFPASKSNRAMYSKSARDGRNSRVTKRVGIHSDATRTNTPHRAESPHIPPPPVKKISNMRDTACIVKRWQEDDKVREEKLNRWRMRMSFAATRRGNLAKVLTRAKSGR